MIQHLKKAKRRIVLSSELKKTLQHIVFTGCCGGVRMCTRTRYCCFYVSIVHTDKNVHFEIAEPAVWPPPEPHTRSCRGSKSKAGSLPPGLSGRANSQTEDTPPICFRQRCDSTTNGKTVKWRQIPHKHRLTVQDEGFKPQLNTLMYIIRLFVFICVCLCTVLQSPRL